MGEVVQGVEEAQPDVLCSSSVQYRTGYMYIHAFGCIRACMYMCACECVCMCLCMYVSVCVCLCLCLSE